MSDAKSIQDRIRQELTRIRCQIKSGNEAEVLIWAIPGELACSQRPLRDHPQYEEYKPLPPEAKQLVVQWVKQIKNSRIQSIICLLECDKLTKYYGGLGLHEGGLLGYYRSQGLDVRHFPMTDYQPPQEDYMRVVLGTFHEMPKPVLMHCSAGIDRTAPVAAYIVEHHTNRDQL